MRVLSFGLICVAWGVVSIRAEPFTAADARDRCVNVDSPGAKPSGTWRPHPTRTLAGLDGYVPTSAPAVDRWGGRMDRTAFPATGFFHTVRYGDRWWLVTPDGHLFWNIGINAVRAPRGTKLSAAEFATQATHELRELGFNGLGNFSTTEFRAAPNPLPWTIRMNVAASFAQSHHQTYATSGHTGFIGQVIPVFHPDFADWARAQAAKLAATADDPSVIGIFTDNELQCPVDLLDRSLRLPENDPYLRYGRAAALMWLQDRGGPTDPSKLTNEERYAYIAYVFGRYVRVVHDTIRAVDRHHLILGPRFNVHRGQFDNPEFWRAVGPWIDVAAVNYYGEWGPNPEQIDGWSEEMDRPVMLTEWYAKAMDAPKLANTNGAGWVVRTQADRARFYQHFALAAFETPALVGFHYFKFLDDDADSVALDSAGGANKGMWKADGTPWPELQAAARAVNGQLYPLLDFFDERRLQQVPTPK